MISSVQGLGGVWDEAIVLWSYGGEKGQGGEERKLGGGLEWNGEGERKRMFVFRGVCREGVL